MRDRIEQACSERLAFLGHEFRAPLGAIAGMAEVLNHGELSDENRRCVDTILTCCSALGTLVDSFLDFSRIEAGQLALRRSDFDLHDVVDHILDMFAYSANAKDIEYGALVDPDVPTALRGDPDRLRQVLINLVGNALKFTDRGHVVVRVTLERDDSHSAVVRFLVRDTGLGITDEARQALFQPFSGLDRYPGESQSGLGLGLYIAKHLVACMDGEIGVESNAPETGSSFWFTARLERRPADAQDVWSPPEALSGVRVLVLHESSPLRDILVAQTAACGARVRAEQDVAHGLREIRAAAYAGDPYEIILADTKSDRLGIFSLLESIQKDRDLPAPKTIMLTPIGRVSEPIINTPHETQTRLTKPVTQSRLADALLQALGKNELGYGGACETYATRIVALRALRNPDEVQNARPDERRILLVEDNLATQQALSQLLRKIGFAVEVSDSGKAAVDASGKNCYDAILMDCFLPDMDGRRAAAEIRRRERGTRRTPIICLTGASLESAREGLDRGDFDDYLRKPTRVKELRSKLDRWCPARERDDERDLSVASTLTDPVVVEGLKRTFVKDGRARLELLREAVGQGNFRVVAQAAHAFYGGCLMVGASDLAKACQSLEALARRGVTAPLAEVLSRVEREFGRIEETSPAAAAATTERGPAR